MHALVQLMAVVFGCLVTTIAAVAGQNFDECIKASNVSITLQVWDTLLVFDEDICTPSVTPGPVTEASEDPTNKALAKFSDVIEKKIEELKQCVKNGKRDETCVTDATKNFPEQLSDVASKNVIDYFRTCGNFNSTDANKYKKEFVEHIQELGKRFSEGVVYCCD